MVRSNRNFSLQFYLFGTIRGRKLTHSVQVARTCQYLLFKMYFLCLNRFVDVFGLNIRDWSRYTVNSWLFYFFNNGSRGIKFFKLIARMNFVYPKQIFKLIDPWQLTRKHTKDRFLDRVRGRIVYVCSSK